MTGQQSGLQYPARTYTYAELHNLLLARFRAHVKVQREGGRNAASVVELTDIAAQLGIVLESDYLPLVD